MSDRLFTLAFLLVLCALATVYTSTLPKPQSKPHFAVTITREPLPDRSTLTFYPGP